jgi:hypothetical protein
LLCSFLLPTLHVAILSRSSTGPRILPPPIFVLHFYIYYLFGPIFTYLLFVSLL